MRRLVVLTAVSVTALACPTRADLIYNQTSDFAASNIHVGSYFGSWIATNNVGLVAAVYDNFTLGGSYSISRVQWQGGYINPNTVTSISAFTITFYSDSGNLPGASIMSQTIPGNANETYAGSVRDVPTFNYNTVPTIPFVAKAGTQYWMSIQANLGVAPEWAWHTGTGGDNRMVTVNTSSVEYVSNVDMAFSLFGNPEIQTVPEPSPFVVALVGGLA